ncbi:MAG: hypothetical protein QXP31_06335 [Pyrobaculum sp.]
MRSRKWVVDAPVVTAYLLGEDNPESLEDYIGNGLAPRFAKLEVYNAIWKAYLKQKDNVKTGPPHIQIQPDLVESRNSEADK